MIRPRDLAYLLAGLASAPLWGWRLWRTGKWRTDWGARFGRIPPLPPAPRTLLLHGVSLGEINATRSLVRALRELDPGLRIVLSATTDTGFARARALYDAEHPVVRFPFDLTPAVRGFLDSIRPDAVALMELELWPTFMDECQMRRIPVAVVNGRLSPRSFRRYRRVRPLVHSMFARVEVAAVQTEEYAARFRALGTRPDRVHVVDNLKWEVPLPGDAPSTGEGRPSGEGVAGAASSASASGTPAALAAALGIDRTRPLVVGGSTAPGEEAMLAEALPTQVQLLLAPRRPERFEAVAAAFPGVIRRTSHPDGTERRVDPSTRVFLLDTLGELGNAYALADVAVVGRSFVPGYGGSDPIEPAARGRPVVIGPDHGNFAEVVEAFREGGAILVADHPGKAAAALLADPAEAFTLATRGMEVIRRHRGAASRTAALLLSLLPGPGSAPSPRG